MPLYRNYLVTQSFLTQGWITGQNLYHVIHGGPAQASTAQVYDTLRVTPMIVPVLSVIQNIGIELMTASTDTGPVVFRIGVYGDNGFFYPGSLIYDSGGAINAKASPAFLQVACNIVLSPGVYWFGGVPQSASGTSAPPSLRSMTTLPYDINTGNTTAPTTGNQFQGYAQSLGASSGALPANFTTTHTLSTIACPRITVQLK